MKAWWEKEYAYEKAYAAGRQSKYIWQYIPAGLQAFVIDAYSDSDGYWIWLESGYVAYDGGDDCRIIHEYTINDLKQAIKTIRTEA